MQRTPSGNTERTMSSSASLPLRSSSVSSSYALSKWSSIARLLRPVTKIISVMPHAAASSTAYWMSGLSTIGSISFGLALVTGRKRLPSPATGNTAFLSLAEWAMDAGSEILQHFEEFFFLQYAHAERAGALALAPGALAGDHDIGLLAHRPRHFVPLGLERRPCRVARHARQRPGQDECLHRPGFRLAGGPRGRRGLGPAHPRLAQGLDRLPVVGFL